MQKMLCKDRYTAEENVAAEAAPAGGEVRGRASVYLRIKICNSKTLCRESEFFVTGDKYSAF